MITINGRKMGKSYNNVIKLTELFSGNHPLLEQAYHPMVVRFYILQTHYRSTLDFSNEALQASEKALRRLWDAYDVALNLQVSATEPTDPALDESLRRLCQECHDFIADDFNTARVVANLFELAPTINGLHGGQVQRNAVSADTFRLMLNTFHTFLELIFGLKPLKTATSDKLSQVMDVLIALRREARLRKDWALSDSIRDQLAAAGIQLKDEKDGTVSYAIV